MPEGLADLALYAAIGPNWGAWAGEIYADLGLCFDGERAEAVSEAAAALADVRQDAALMLHDEHRDVDDVVDVLKRGPLVDDRRTRQMLQLLSAPVWRANAQHLRRGLPAAAGLAGGPTRRRQPGRTVRAAA
jgi:hypothetical protein